MNILERFFEDLTMNNKTINSLLLEKILETINISDEEKEKLIKITINLDNNLFILFDTANRTKNIVTDCDSFSFLLELYNIKLTKKEYNRITKFKNFALKVLKEQNSELYVIIKKFYKSKDKEQYKLDLKKYIIKIADLFDNFSPIKPLEFNNILTMKTSAESCFMDLYKVDFSFSVSKLFFTELKEEFKDII